MKNPFKKEDKAKKPYMREYRVDMYVGRNVKIELLDGTKLDGILGYCEKEGRLAINSHYCILDPETMEAKDSFLVYDVAHIMADTPNAIELLRTEAAR